MGIRIHRGNRWRELVSSLAAELTAAPPGPFEEVRVIVSSRGAGRMLSQALAAQLPTGVCAGLSFITLPEWIRATAAQHGLQEELEAWRSVRAVVAATGVLAELADEHPILGSHLNANGSPARRQLLAQRSMRLFRRYVDHCPAMVARWLEDDDVDALGSELAEHLTWQPALLRGVAEQLEVDPVEVWTGLAGAVASSATEHIRVFALPQVAAAHVGILAAAAQAGSLEVWQVSHSGYQDWTHPLDPGHVPADQPAPPTAISIHGSHGPSRQVEVLRDELTRRFAADPTLEPRDVLVVCEDPGAWGPHLRSVFAPIPEDPAAHPGRGLRLQVASSLEANLVVELVRRCLRISESRATASDLVELMLLSPVAHRWRLRNRRDELIALVADSGIRWGLDQHHRSQIGVPGISQNTWVRGVDRLLAGIALAPGSAAPVAVTGVPTVSNSDLDLIGTIGELLSRVRRFNLLAATAAPVSDWVDRVRQLLTDVVGCSFDDEWMLLQTNSALSSLAEQLRGEPEPLGRSEFTRLFESVTADFAPRPTVGNGALQVVGVGDLAHVDFRLVCLLGIGDRHGNGDVDTVPLGNLPDSRKVRLARLVSHARAADEVLVVGQTRDPLTNQDLAGATTISWLLRELGVTDPGTVQHPLLAHSESNFTDGRSFDKQGLSAAIALREAATGTLAPHVVRRRAALALPHADEPREVTIRELVTFLKDPAKDFLRSAAGVRLFNAPDLADELPLVLDGLEEWGVRDRLLTAFKEGMTPDEAEVLEVQRELLPPGQIGRRLLAEQLYVAKDQWRRAWQDWSAEPADHRVELALGNIVLADTIRTRGGRLVEVSPSSGTKTQVESWLQLLALAASGIPTGAIIHRTRKDYGLWHPESAQLAAQTPELAREVLGSVTRAWSQSRSRLVPLPLEPALQFAQGVAEHDHQDKHWEVTSPPWEAKWSRIPQHWRLFYSEVPSELFSDAATSRDPAPPPEAGHGSAFAAWSAAIYLPMFQGGE